MIAVKGKVFQQGDRLLLVGLMSLRSVKVFIMEICLGKGNSHMNLEERNIYQKASSSRNSTFVVAENPKNYI